MEVMVGAKVGGRGTRKKDHSEKKKLLLPLLLDDLFPLVLVFTVCSFIGGREKDWKENYIILYINIVN